MSTFQICCKDDGYYIAKHTNNPVYKFDVYPLGLARGKPPEDLAKMVALCLKEQLESRGGSVNPRSLLGECHINSVSLLEKLSSKGYDPNLLLGWNSDAGSPKSLIEAYNKTKNVHQWVELGKYTLEICSEGTQSCGQMYVSQLRPSNYQESITLSLSEYRGLGVEYITSKNIEDVIADIQK